MSNYIFRFPADMPELTYKGLTAYLGDQDTRMLGTTVEVRRGDVHRFWAQIPRGDGVILRLYNLDLARITPASVTFTSTDDPHLATTEWLAAIVRGNRIGSCVWRTRRRKADGPGPECARGRAGLLIISGDRDKTVFGRTYPVGEPWTPPIRRG